MGLYWISSEVIMALHTSTLKSICKSFFRHLFIYLKIEVEVVIEVEDDHIFLFKIEILSH